MTDRGWRRKASRSSSRTAGWVPGSEGAAIFIPPLGSDDCFVFLCRTNMGRRQQQRRSPQPQSPNQREENQEQVGLDWTGTKGPHDEHQRRETCPGGTSVQVPPPPPPPPCSLMEEIKQIDPLQEHQRWRPLGGAMRPGENGGKTRKTKIKSVYIIIITAA